MTVPRTPLPSPLAGEGAERRRREAGEGAFKIATERARSLRRRMTDAERKLWFALRDRRFANYKFRRQVPIGPFFADFVCFDARVVVEVDGRQHAESARDQRRDRWFEQNDFLTLRYWNNDIFRNLEGVLTVLLELLRSRTPHPAPRLRSAPPSPARGEGSESAAGAMAKTKVGLR